MAIKQKRAFAILLFGPLLSMLLMAIPVQAVASDISFYGGRQFNDVSDQNSLAASLGIDIPGFLLPLSPNQLRTDVSYIFTTLDVPLNDFLSADPNSFLETDIGTLTLHTGPGWRLEILDRVAFVVSAQAGVTITKADSEIIGTSPPNVNIFNEVTDTNFSYQFPVALEYGFSKRIGATVRYRGLGIVNGGAGYSHFIEAGIAFRF